jgi:hypothetical protein
VLDFILLMHNDAKTSPTLEMWPPYLSSLRDRCIFDGGSSIGAGQAFRKDAMAGTATDHLGGYIRVQAKSLEAARELLTGNPVFECGGTVEIRELPRN